LECVMMPFLFFSLCYWQGLSGSTRPQGVGVPVSPTAPTSHQLYSPHTQKRSSSSKEEIIALAGNVVVNSSEKLSWLFSIIGKTVKLCV